MKKIITAALLLCVILLQGCESGTTENKAETSAVNQEVTTSVKSETDETKTYSLREIAEKAVEAAKYDVAPTISVKGDDYAEDLLMFNYGVEEHTEAVADYFLSEAPSNSANAVAYLVLNDGTDGETKDYIKNAVETVFVGGLKSAVEAYNPDAYKLCENYLLRDYGDALLLVISENPEEVAAAVESMR